MRIIFLGTNGWYSTKTGDTICTLIELKTCYIVFDAGEGFRKLNKYIKKDLPVYVFLSHLHLDHVYGLHIFPRMNFGKRVTVIVPESKYKNLIQLAGSPYTVTLKKIIARIMPVKAGNIKGLPFFCECRQLEHQDGAFGYRIIADKKIIAYCSDTGFCKKTIDLAKNSDLLIHECTLKPGFYDAGWGHVNPEEAACVAKEAGVKKLILTHFMPDHYPTIKSRQRALVAAKSIFKNSVIAEDDKTFFV